MNGKEEGGRREEGPRMGGHGRRWRERPRGILECRMASADIEGHPGTSEDAGDGEHPKRAGPLTGHLRRAAPLQDLAPRRPGPLTGWHPGGPDTWAA
jgi:hypothetical protein